MSQRQNKPEILHTEVVARSRLFQIEQVHLKFSNGVERQYERMKGGSRGAVMIVPIHQGKMLLAREYAAGTDNYELGFPKGLIDPGETAIEAANRELQEEIGFGANKLTLLKELSLAPGYFSSKMQIFLAEDLYESRLEGDEPEPIDVVPWALADWEALLDDVDFSESRSVSALFLAQKYLYLNIQKMQGLKGI
ncbi:MULTISPECIES: ADP compounds hydrolase NudE [unclassified Shewanella]|uniref:ADP compounds hydrolase NudE n=1 Tax=unclassified Shewanella TaxID=196818 RepID=UPI001038D624|nr:MULTISPECIES: ADP compounds hydrolase NudE [unclassified Shewanella]MCU8004116.1 ADP compounds hydrolase NudE [Shewanella sp. SM96]MCU8010306.1 ADP compounds hydrolase NudE [Shewanella sp. SM87]MCU8062177.1 ADP compounds hydrolase NudE [Shewanella sp. SM55]MCU8070429.1 ADP compounds hydrolase NudE [Shewanella sp. SM32]MCU8088878.1 ADP compounds hydrolase NudE [Shewanella sp. SM21]